MTADLTVAPTLQDYLAVACPGLLGPAQAVSGPVRVLSAFRDPGVVGVAIAQVADELGTDDLPAVGFTVFFEVVHSLIAVPLASLVHHDLGPLVLDLDRSRLLVGIEDRQLWPVLVPVTDPDERLDTDTAVAVVGAWLAAEIAQVAEAFGPHLRVGPRSYAEAAGSILAGQADRIGRRFGVLDRARQVAAALTAAAGGALRPLRYVEVDLGPVRVSAPQPGVCCRWYRVSDNAFCAGCPREPQPARAEHHRDWLVRTLLAGPGLLPGAALPEPVVSGAGLPEPAA